MNVFYYEYVGYSATLPARFRHKGGAPAQQPSPFFKEQPSADFSTFKPSDDSDENRVSVLNVLRDASLQYNSLTH